MFEIIDVADLDCLFLSYDEPNKEEHWARLLDMVPWAKRIDGIEGSDTAHKAVANYSKTSRFILIDGDNIPDEKFFNLQLKIDDSNKDCVFRWKSRNNINGLIYGNGGISCWPVQFVLNMKSHENSNQNDTKNLVEFCFDKKYKAMYNCYSTTYPNGSALQAFRAGFREGVKMLLNNGSRPIISDFKLHAHKRNLNHLYIWQTVGMDVKYGDYAIFGARLGSYKLLFESNWDYIQVRDFKYLTQLYNDECLTKDWINHSDELLNSLKKEIDFPIVNMSAESSKFFKQHYNIHKNIDIMIQEMDVIKKIEGW